MYKTGKFRRQELLKRAALGFTVAICIAWGASFSADLYCQTRLTSWGISRGSLYFYWNELHEDPPRKSLDISGDLLDGKWRLGPLGKYESYETELYLSISLLVFAVPCFLAWVVLAARTRRQSINILTKACIQCGYPLTFNSSSACPECGMSRNDQILAASETVASRPIGLKGKCFRYGVWIMVGIVWMISIVLPLLCHKAQWTFGGARLGVVSGWIVYEQEPTLSRESSFRDGIVLSPDDWFLDSWFSWESYQACHQIRVKLSVMAIFLSLLIGVRVARSVVSRPHTIALRNALGSLQEYSFLGSQRRDYHDK